MASQPPQRFVSQNVSHHHTSASGTPSEATASGQNRRSSIPQSTSSEDSQTVLLNRPSSSESSPQPEVRQKRNTTRPNPKSAPSSKEPRKCWICFGDETEDLPTSSQWRSPCPCALTAHESCLLDWVADLEAPTKGKSTPPDIQCPQCKAKITIARPRSPIIHVIRTIERITGRLLIPFVFITLAGTMITGCWVHGYSTVFLLFGPDDAERVLGIANGLKMTNTWGLTLPFIPMALIASRTAYTDNLLPIIPIFYFASNAPRREGALWPPSVAFTLATLPYIRAAYNEFYNRVLAPKEKEWTKAIQPQATDDEDGERQGQEQNQGEPENQVPEGADFELDLHVELVDEEEVEEEENQGRPGQPPEDVPVGDQAQNQVQDALGHLPNPAPDQRQPHIHHHLPPELQHHLHPHPHPQAPQAELANEGGVAGRWVINTFTTAHLIIGALLFPTVSAAMGALLRVTLPKTWTTPPSRWDRYPVGFLQSRFGRSIAGGCLFVALKDTLLLYSKYRLAHDHKKRRVVDYVAKKDKKANA